MPVTTTRRLSQNKTYAVVRSGGGSATVAKTTGQRRLPASTQTGSATYAADGQAQILEAGNYDVTDGAMYPVGPQPQSIVDAATAAARRVLAAVDADNGAPSLVTHGKALYNARRINIFAKIAANTATLSVYLYSATAGQWFQTSYALGLDATADDGRSLVLALDVSGGERVYLRTINTLGAIDAWIDLLED